MSVREDDFLQLSGLQHFAFCRRQWALIHVEQQWRDNLRTEAECEEEAMADRLVASHRKGKRFFAVFMSKTTGKPQK